MLTLRLITALSSNLTPARVRYPLPLHSDEDRHGCVHPHAVGPRDDHGRVRDVQSVLRREQPGRMGRFPRWYVKVILSTNYTFAPGRLGFACPLPTAAHNHHHPPPPPTVRTHPPPTTTATTTSSVPQVVRVLHLVRVRASVVLVRNFRLEPGPEHTVGLANL